MLIIAAFFTLLATLLRWAGHSAILAGLTYGIYTQIINSVAIATLTLLALAVLTLFVQLLANGLSHIASASAPISSDARRY